MKKIVIGGIVAALSLSACASATESAEPAPTVTVTATPKVVEPALVESDTYIPDLSEFDVTLKVVDKQCFGSAGCNVEVEAKVAADTDALPSEGSIDLTFRVSGDESGPIIDTTTLYLEDGQYDVITIRMSTSNQSVKPKAKVTDAEYSNY